MDCNCNCPMVKKRVGMGLKNRMVKDHNCKCIFATYDLDYCLTYLELKSIVESIEENMREDKTEVIYDSPVTE